MPRSKSLIPLFKNLEVKHTNCGGKKERNRKKNRLMYITYANNTEPVLFGL